MMKSRTDQSEQFVQWLDEYRPLIWKVVRIYARAPEDGQDLFQEIALQLWRSMDSFRGEAKASTWVYRVALNTAMAWRRKHRKHRQARDYAEGRQHETAVNSAENRDKLDWLYAEIRELPETDRSLVLLYLDGLSYREMSEVLGISESNVGVKINRTKKYLAGRLKGLSDEP